jgi:hypothetical protein
MSRVMAQGRHLSALQSSSSENGRALTKSSRSSVGGNWFLDLFEAVPTPEKAANVREKTIARILKNHRIRRFDAAHVLSELRKPALAVAPGIIEAAIARIRGLIERIRLVNGQRTSASPTA